jgi:hypothetical protein
MSPRFLEMERATGVATVGGWPMMPNQTGDGAAAFVPNGNVVTTVGIGPASSSIDSPPWMRTAPYGQEHGWQEDGPNLSAQHFSALASLGRGNWELVGQDDGREMARS